MLTDDDGSVCPPACRLCDGRMKVDVYFAPCGSNDGMVVFVCPDCGNVVSHIIEPKPAERRLPS